MAHRDDRGMATAEYTIGTLGAVLMATVLYKMGVLGVDGPWLDGLFDKIEQALSWRNIFKGMPRLGIRS
ncbi:DUF4244 domain-containing protein [Aeromicrobium chenweiae]|uniref:DUF4244 domain-containing protein n=1 Tax=Aeromicrobium chenweiae TaxID=2079793 RepID=A0A2S0WI96_9ACTN|nr:DUF4244 domain-containing protein [Aeromicrobium chenweiae]AWB91004.1 DUF4244 domain-containing protein [Aeromicrobium chenweiae]TGN31908.1 DUF4244 domain-containing protein [Aeromicrobium chenweiae]